MSKPGLANALQRHRRLILLLSLLLAAVAFWSLPWFTSRFLCVDDLPIRADALVVMGGGTPVRSQHAAELYHAGKAPKLIVTGAGDCLDNFKLLVAAGVPTNAILVEAQAKSTRQNAQLSLPMLRSLGVKQVIIVTTWYHSRRALRCFQHYAPEIRFYSSPSYYGFSPSEWKESGLVGQVRYEYLKTAGYWLFYGICPF